jgi:hypothetical protein
MKSQNNPKKLKEASWHRDGMAINLLLHKINEEIKDFERRRKVKLVVKTDLDRSLYFEKVFFEEVKENVIVKV